MKILIFGARGEQVGNKFTIKQFCDGSCLTWKLYFFKKVGYCRYL